MRLDSMDPDGEFIRRCHERTRTDSDFTGRDAGPDVSAKNSPYFRKPVAKLLHVIGSFSRFFTWLEDQVYIAPYLIPHIHEHPGRTEEHGNMIIMTAGMHPSRYIRSKGKARFFFYRQRIDIGPQGYGFTRLRTGYLRNKTGILCRVDLIRDAPSVQCFRYPTGRLRFFKTEFWMLMKFPAQPDNVITIQIHQIVLFHIHSLHSYIILIIINPFHYYIAI